jgi:hypothetical protein
MILPYIDKLHPKIEIYFDFFFFLDQLTNKIKNKSKVKTISKLSFSYSNLY